MYVCHLCIYIHTYIFTHLYICVYAYTVVHVIICVCVCMCVYINIHTCIHIHRPRCALSLGTVENPSGLCIKTPNYDDVRKEFTHTAWASKTSAPYVPQTRFPWHYTEVRPIERILGHRTPFWSTVGGLGLIQDALEEPCDPPVWATRNL